MRNVEKNLEDNSGLFEKEVFRNIIITVVTSFPFFYIFGAMLLWQYLDMQNIRGEFPSLVTSNNLLLSIALLGMFAAFLLLLYLLSARYFIKNFIKNAIKNNNILENKKPRYSLLSHFFIVLAPLLFLLGLKLFFDNDWIVWLLSSFFFSVIGYVYWFIQIKNIVEKDDYKQSYKEYSNVLSFIFLAVLLALYNITPLLIMINMVEKYVVGELLSFITLCIAFALYSLFIAIFVELNNRKYFIMAIFFTLIVLLFVVLKFSNVPLNVAKIIGLGHACIDLTLKEKAISKPFLEKLHILSDESSPKFTNVYVLLSKNTNEYIVSKGYGSLEAQRIPYSDIENEGFLKDCL